MKRPWPRLLTAVGVTAALITGCAGRQPATTPAATASPSTSPTPGTPPSTAGPTTGPAGTTNPTRTTGPARLSWPTGPTTVVHRPVVPPVPVLEHVRYAAHPEQGYDRIVFDFDHAMPGYQVRYVSQVRADPSDRPVSVPGHRFLLIVFTPAQAHENDGEATVSGTHRVDLPAVRGYAVAGDYEGYVSVAVGLDRVTGYRLGELPGRIYLDVAA